MKWDQETKGEEEEVYVGGGYWCESVKTLEGGSPRDWRMAQQLLPHSGAREGEKEKEGFEGEKWKQVRSASG
jgi:hypothetical protein